jgi:hypothetical protein
MQISKGVDAMELKPYSMESIIIESAKASIDLLKDNTYFVGGNNGPHNHNDTPVRNTSHWIITNLKAYEITSENSFLEASRKLTDFLMSDQVRPCGYTFIQRITGGPDRCNGVIGQAWVIEALVKAYSIFHDEKILKLAIDSCALLPFDNRIGLWKRREINGKVIGFDLTLNHQIWFAAACSCLVNKDKHINKCLEVFLDKLPENISLSRVGCFKMPISSKSLLINGHPICVLRTSKVLKKIRRSDKFGKSVEAGYHAFHLYGLAIIKENIPDHPIWKNSILKKAMEYLLSSDYKTEVIKSKYGLGYNPPGFEIAYSLQSFKDIIVKCSEKDVWEKIYWWLKFQIDHTYNFEEKLLNNVEYDPITYAARLYEAVRIDDKYLRIKL